MTRMENENFSQERALYGAKDIFLFRCSFEGEEDGESALKESAAVTAEECKFALRYPLWHVDGATLTRCRMTEGCRAALWYTNSVSVQECDLSGVKALRECADVRLENSRITSAEFGWFSRNITVRDCTVSGEYTFLRATALTAENLQFSGKYSFQYLENAVFSHCNFDTKDAFWHSKNVTVTDSVIRGEYLGWYAEDLHLVRCHIIGTQPLCYARGLILEDCTMEKADLAFEKSEVNGTILSHVDSIKAPDSGHLTVLSVGEVLPQNDGTMGGADLTILAE